jgi:hypothetical protein
MGYDGITECLKAAAGGEYVVRRVTSDSFDLAKLARQSCTNQGPVRVTFRWRRQEWAM